MNLMNVLTARIAAQHMLNHPFYQRWTAGDLSRDELQQYAREYYHFTVAFPTFVSSVHGNSSDVEIRQSLLENLIEEERGPENHPELWLRFCESLGLTRTDVRSTVPSESTTSLIETMRSLTRHGEVHEGLAALYAYESQVPSVATSKIKGLAESYGISSDRDVKFFTVHEEADVLHARTSEELLSRLCDTEEKKNAAVGSAEQTLGALYTFLDGVNTGSCAMTA